MLSFAAAPGSRYDCSLGLLTRRFVGLVQQANNGVLDLNSASDQLGVQVLQETTYMYT
jgi:transcription factor E2F3